MYYCSNFSLRSGSPPPARKSRPRLNQPKTANVLTVCINVFSHPLVIRRANNNWQTNFASLSTKSNENSPQSNKKQRDCGETARDSIAYSCLLKNELLGTGIEDVKSAADDKVGLLSNSNRPGLFKYQSPTKQVGLFVAFGILCWVIDRVHPTEKQIKARSNKNKPRMQLKCNCFTAVAD